eukprot:11714-Rhodomonas_salina.1
MQLQNGHNGYMNKYDLPSQQRNDVLHHVPAAGPALQASPAGRSGDLAEQIGTLRIGHEVCLVLWHRHPLNRGSFCHTEAVHCDDRTARHGAGAEILPWARDGACLPVDASSVLHLERRRSVMVSKVGNSWEGGAPDMLPETGDRLVSVNGGQVCPGSLCWVLWGAAHALAVMPFFLPQPETNAAAMTRWSGCRWKG